VPRIGDCGCVSSFSWFSGAFLGADAKFAPAFLNGKGLATRITDPQKGFLHSAANGSVRDFLTGTVLPHAHLFAWLIALGELAVACSLVLGLLTRLGAALGIVQNVVYLLVAGTNGADTVGHNYMLGLVGVVLAVTAAGRVGGLDRLLLARFPDSRLLRLLA